MKLSKIVPVLGVVAMGLVGSVGCAANADDSASSTDNLTAGAGVDFTTAVGAIVVDGQKVCTAALVDVDASARIGGVSASGRQIVFGEACVGKLKNGYGAAVFVSMANGVSVSTPIAAFDFKSQASAGLGIGILTKTVPGATPIEAIGTSELVNAGASVASVIEANQDGILIGAEAEIHAGVAFSFKSQCASLSFGVEAGVAVGAGVHLGEDGLGGAAFVKVNGKLRFAASIDAGCVVHHIGDVVVDIASDVLDAANGVETFLNGIGTGDVVAVVNTKKSETTFAIRLEQDAKEIRINGEGYIHAKAPNGVTCTKIPLLLIGGPCELRPANGYKKGQLVTITFDTALSLPSTNGQNYTVSLSNEDPAPANDDNENGG